MKNKSLLHKTLPYEEKGRWFKFFIEVDGGAYKITTKDKECSISGTTLKISGLEIIDYKTRIHSDAASVTTFDRTMRIFADGSQGVNLPPVACTDYFTVWVFGVPV